MDDSLRAAWDWQADAARHADEASRDPRRSWVPPTLAVLVAAVRATTLARLYPFTSHHRFCLSDGPQWWMGEGQVAPAFVSRLRHEGYIVWSGAPYDASAREVLSTEDPKAAAVELERLLDRWPALAPTPSVA
jgi:hypothetical protein